MPQTDLQSNTKREGEAKKAVKGMGWLSLGRMAGMAVSFISTAILARLLAPADFGVMATSLIVIALATAIFDGAFAVGVVQRKTIDDDYISSAFWLSLILAGVCAAAVSLCSPLLAAFFNIKQYSLIFAVSSLSLLFKAMENISLAYMRRQSRFVSITFYQFASSLIGFGPLSIWLALNGFGPWALIWGQLAVSVLSGFSSFVLARLPLRLAITKDATMDIVQTSGHFVLASVLNWGALTGSNAVTGHKLGANALGIYSRGWRLLDLATTATAAPMQSVLVPAFARFQDQEDRAREAYARALALSVPFFAMISVLCCVHSAAIVQIALGPKWTATVPIVEILFAVLVPRCCYKITESLTVAFGHSKSAALRQGIYAVLMIGGAMIAAPHGAIWVAVSTSVAVTIFYISSLTYSGFIVRLPVSETLTIHLRAIVLALAVAAVDLGIIHLFGHRFWLGNITGGIVAVILIAGLFLCLPSGFIGQDINKLRDNLIKRIVNRPQQQRIT